MNPTTKTKRKTITLERTFTASVDEVWELWTTKDGLEAWWGPRGFTTEVLNLEPRLGGILRYRMTATDAQMVAFMKQANLPLSTETRGSFEAFDPKTGLTLTQILDFIPGVEPYPMAARVKLVPEGGQVHMTVVLDAAHDQLWTERSVAGWEQQLDRLVETVGAKPRKSTRR